MRPRRANQSFLLHAAIYGLGTLALQAASVILVPLYTRCLAPAEYGVLEVLSRVGEIFNICLLINGIRLAAFTFYCQAEPGQDRKRTAATVLWAQGILLLGSGTVAILLAPHVGGLIGVRDPSLLMFGILMILVDGMTIVPLALIQARVESGYYISIMAGMFATRITLTILFVVHLGWGIWGVLGASAATSGAFGVYLTWRELSRSTYRPDWKKLREILRFAVPFVPAGICGLVLHNGDRFFLMNFRGATEVGQYTLGYKLAMAVGMLSIGPLTQVWTARMYDAFKRPDASRYVGRVCTRILLVYIFAAMGLCILENEVVHLLAVPSYYGATSVIDVLALAYFFWNAANLMDAPLWVCRRSVLKPWILAVSSAMSLSLCALLIPGRGVQGAALAVLAGLATHCAVTYLVSQRVFYVRYELGRVFLTLAIAVAITLSSRGVGPGVLGILHKLVLWAAWPTFLWCSGIIARDEKTLVLDGLRRAWRWLTKNSGVNGSRDFADAMPVAGERNAGG